MLSFGTAFRIGHRRSTLTRANGGEVNDWPRRALDSGFGDVESVRTSPTGVRDGVDLVALVVDDRETGAGALEGGVRPAAVGRRPLVGGQALFVSPKTVEAHLGAIYRKLGIRSRTELANRLASVSPGAVV